MAAIRPRSNDANSRVIERREQGVEPEALDAGLWGMLLCAAHKASRDVGPQVAQV